MGRWPGARRFVDGLASTEALIRHGRGPRAGSGLRNSQFGARGLGYSMPVSVRTNPANPGVVNRSQPCPELSISPLSISRRR